MSLTHPNGPHPPSRSSAGCDCNLRLVDDGSTPLHVAAGCGQSDCVARHGVGKSPSYPLVYIYIYKHMWLYVVICVYMCLYVVICGYMWLYIPNMVENGNHTQVMVGKSVENHG